MKGSPVDGQPGFTVRGGEWSRCVGGIPIRRTCAARSRFTRRCAGAARITARGRLRDPHCPAQATPRQIQWTRFISPMESIFLIVGVVSRRERQRRINGVEPLIAALLHQGPRISTRSAPGPLPSEAEAPISMRVRTTPWSSR